MKYELMSKENFLYGNEELRKKCISETQIGEKLNIIKIFNLF